jgi:pimeloyl-ACP methyl ester carboxylesterase
MESLFVSYKASTIHYVRFGHGKRILCCFHGYGESGRSFHFLEKGLEDDFTLVALDFPLHGETIWNQGLLFTLEDLLAILEQTVPSLSTNQVEIYLLGYSMGGRVALSVVGAIPAKIKKILLIAPDGLGSGFWYRFATQNLTGNRLFWMTMKKPGWFFWLLRLTRNSGLVNRSIFKFVNYYLHDKRVRMELYGRWMTMRKFTPDIKRVKSHIVQNKIQTRLLYGEFDNIIRHQRAGHFMHGIEPLCKLSVIPAGHQLLQEKNEAIILELITN